MATLLHVTNLMRSIRTRAHLPRDGGGPCPGCPRGFCVAVRVVHTRTTLASSGGPPGTDVSWRSPRPRRTRPAADWTSSPSRSSRPAGTAADPPNENTSFLPHLPGMCNTRCRLRRVASTITAPPSACASCVLWKVTRVSHRVRSGKYFESVLPHPIIFPKPAVGGGLVLVFC